MQNDRDVRIIRDLAKQYAEIAAKEIQDERRDLWRRHNSLERTRPLVYVRWFAAWNEAPESRLQCEDPFYQTHERVLRQLIFQDTLGDDYVIEPWITQRATVVMPPGGWGFEYVHNRPAEGGAWQFEPPMTSLEDIEKVASPHHVIDEEDTARNVARLRDAVGDILEVDVDRRPAYMSWRGDISYDLAQLRGLTQLMWDMADNPEWLHRLAKHLSDSIVRYQDEAEDAGDWRLSSHSNQAMCYAKELADPKANSEPVKRKDLWLFMAAQEFALISPQMHDEFLFQYQFPILEKFGLTAYGCCEDLTEKIDMLRRLPNLRRIGVTPVANVRRSAEQIGEDYVFSWRPNPAEMICCGFDPDHVRKVIRQGMEDSKGCHVDITLKDVQTVQNKPENLREWVKVVRSVTDEYA